MSTSGVTFFPLPPPKWKQTSSWDWFSCLVHHPPLCIFNYFSTLLWISLLLWPTNLIVAPHRRFQSLSSNIGSNPPSRCCLLAESIHVWHRDLTFVQICAIDFYLCRKDPDLWPLMYNVTHVRFSFIKQLWIWIGINRITNHQLQKITGTVETTELLDQISANQHSHGWREKK